MAAVSQALLAGCSIAEGTAVGKGLAVKTAPMGTPPRPRSPPLRTGTDVGMSGSFVTPATRWRMLPRRLRRPPSQPCERSAIVPTANAALGQRGLLKQRTDA